MAHDVFLLHINEGNTFNVTENAACLNKTTALRGRKVYLCRVTSYHHFSIPAHTSQEHLDLRCCRVLGFVKNHHSIIECTTTHKCYGSNLYNTILDIFLQFHGRKHLLKGIIKWLKVRVNLIFHIAWQETKFFSCFHSWATQNDFLYFFVLKRTNSQGYRKKSLSWSSRTRNKEHIILVVSLNNFALIDTSWNNRLSPHRVHNSLVVSMVSLFSRILENLNHLLLI